MVTIQLLTKNNKSKIKTNNKINFEIKNFPDVPPPVLEQQSSTVIQRRGTFRDIRAQMAAQSQAGDVHGSGPFATALNRQESSCFFQHQQKVQQDATIINIIRVHRSGIQKCQKKVNKKYDTRVDCFGVCFGIALDKGDSTKAHDFFMFANFSCGLVIHSTIQETACAAKIPLMISRQCGSHSLLSCSQQSKQKKFENVDEQNRNMEQCAICLGDYVDTDEIAELKCDQRHYFHSECLKEWLKRKLECPLCKKEIKP
eukprot:403357417